MDPAAKLGKYRGIMATLEADLGKGERGETSARFRGSRLGFSHEGTSVLPGGYS